MILLCWKCYLVVLEQISYNRYAFWWVKKITQNMTHFLELDQEFIVESVREHKTMDLVGFCFNLDRNPKIFPKFNQL